MEKLKIHDAQDKGDDTEHNQHQPDPKVNHHQVQINLKKPISGTPSMRVATMMNTTMPSAIPIR